MGSTIKMVGDITGGDEDGIATIDVPMQGHLVGVDWAAQYHMDADAEYFQAQLSFSSDGSFQANDNRAVISEIRAELTLTTSGTVPGGINRYVPMDLPVMAGERIYLHSFGAAGVTGRVGAILHFDFNVPGMVARRRG